MSSESILSLISEISALVWGVPTIILLVGTGLWFTIKLKLFQFRKLGPSLYLALIKRKEDSSEPGDISHFQALMTALSATVGTGNIAGVATAIAVGGPGALFWMWITGLVGMITKYAEALLAVKYRERDKHGNMSGGPMYYISKGLGWKWLGSLFAIFATIAAFGIGNTVQSNSVAHALHSTFGISEWITAIVLVVATGVVILGGIKSIGSVTGLLVPVMIMFYIGGAILILIMNAGAVPGAFATIFEQAFTPTAGAGGFLGATVMLTIRMGVSRGVFSNESGLGSSPIAAAAAQTKSPVSQAMVSMTQTFIDTLVVCTLTGLVIVISGNWTNGTTGAELTSSAFSSGMGSVFGEYIVSIGLTLFAYSTLLGWSYYGERSLFYLAGDKAIKPYRIIFTLFVGIGAVSQLDIVWGIADIFNGLMAFPNLIGLLALTPIVVSETKKFLEAKK